jgi:hypothetical protein
MNRFAFVLVSLGVATSTTASPITNTKCASSGDCYCVQAALEQQISNNIGYFRKQLSDAKASGKLTVYLSVPFSTRGGGYRGINIIVAAATASAVAKQFGSNHVFVLNPSVKAADLAPSALQADYLYMWSSVLAGEDGLGADLDAIYMVGPTDFANALALTGDNKVETVEKLYETRLATDDEFKKVVASGRVTKSEFLVYYTFRSGTAFSAGAHDEWNTIVNINEQRRRKFGDDGFGRQLGVWFDGRQVASNALESRISPGSEAVCKTASPAH